MQTVFFLYVICVVCEYVQLLKRKLLFVAVVKSINKVTRSVKLRTLVSFREGGNGAGELHGVASAPFFNFSEGVTGIHLCFIIQIHYIYIIWDAQIFQFFVKGRWRRCYYKPDLDPISFDLLLTPSSCPTTQHPSEEAGTSQALPLP